METPFERAMVEPCCYLAHSQNQMLGNRHTLVPLCGCAHNEVACVKELEVQDDSAHENDHRFISGVQFVKGDKHRVTINFSISNGSEEITEYH